MAAQASLRHIPKHTLLHTAWYSHLLSRPRLFNECPVCAECLQLAFCHPSCTHLGAPQGTPAQGPHLSGTVGS